MTKEMPEKLKKLLFKEIKEMPMRTPDLKDYCTWDEPHCLHPRQEAFDEGYNMGAHWMYEQMQSRERIAVEALNKYADTEYDWGFAHDSNTNSDFGHAARKALKQLEGE